MKWVSGRQDPRHHALEQPLIPGSGKPHDDVEHLGVGTDEHPCLLLAYRLQDDLGRALGCGVGQLLVENLRDLLGVRPSAAVALRAIAVLMPPGCTQVTATG